ncbi:hypothetical protein [Bradyrhizobium rifense]
MTTGQILAGVEPVDAVNCRSPTIPSRSLRR